MPSYASPRRGVSFSEAYIEAAVSAPVQRAMLKCYELWHPSLDEPVRVVTNTEPIMAKLEPSAPRDPGANVEFLAAFVEAGIYRESDDAASPEVEIRVDNVSGVMDTAFKKSLGSLEGWELIERVYASDDLSGPAQLPVLRLKLATATLGGPTAVLKASIGREVNVDVPVLTFKPEEYPTLAAR